MRPLFAIIQLTWRAAFRYRLFWVLAVLLAVAAVGLPKLVRHDGTANGFTQIVMTYTLGAVTALLGMATLWLACGAIARDIEECQMQMVAVKPVPRWKVWLGKWLGIMSLNAVLLAGAGLAIYAVLQWRASELSVDEQQKLRREVLVARASLKEEEKDIGPIVAANFQAWLRQQEHPERLTELDAQIVRKQIEEMVKAPNQLVKPGYYRVWKLNAQGVKNHLGNNPLYVRIKYYLPDNQVQNSLVGVWRFGSYEAPRLERVLPMAPETYVEFTVPAEAIDEQGNLTINFINKNNSVMVFLLQDGLEVLYREAAFGVNFVRGLLVIWCWLGLMASIGLAAGSFLSFPVAAFFSLGMLIVMMFSGTLTSAVEEGTVMGRNHETGKVEEPVVDRIMMPVFKGILAVVNLVKAYSPVDALSTGRSITWPMVGMAFAQIVLLLGGAFGVVGALAFTRRELASTRGTG